ncbi:MAG: GIY-YIG nuclease family protein [Acidobacteriaceae bacterium]
MPFIYVLYSHLAERHYTGATSNLEQRLAQHNSDQSISTKNRGPWRLVYQEEYATIGEALRRERYLKSGKGREELKRLLQQRQSANPS